MTIIAFPASVVPAGYTVTFDVPKFLHPSSIVGVQGTSVPGTAIENGRVYHFWFQRRPDGEVFNFGLSCNGQPIRNPAHKAALRAVIRAAYDYATRGADTGIDHDAHHGAFLYARLGDMSEVDYLNGAPERGADTGEQHDAHVEALGWEEHARDLEGEAVAALIPPEVIPAAPTFVSIDGDASIAWVEFEAANADGMDAADFAMIRVDLPATGRCTFGGGAGADFEIVVAASPSGDDVPYARDRALVLDCLRTRDRGGDWLGHKAFEAVQNWDGSREELVWAGLAVWTDEGFVITPRGRRAWAEQRRALVDLGEGVALAGVL